VSVPLYRPKDDDQIGDHGEERQPGGGKMWKESSREGVREGGERRRLWGARVMQPLVILLQISHITCVGGGPMSHVPDARGKRVIFSKTATGQPTSPVHPSVVAHARAHTHTSVFPHTTTKISKMETEIHANWTERDMLAKRTDTNARDSYNQYAPKNKAVHAHTHVHGPITTQQYTPRNTAAPPYPPTHTHIHIHPPERMRTRARAHTHTHHSTRTHYTGTLQNTAPDSILIDQEPEKPSRNFALLRDLGQAGSGDVVDSRGTGNAWGREGGLWGGDGLRRENFEGEGGGGGEGGRKPPPANWWGEARPPKKKKQKKKKN